jgi:uncharacterized protein YecT (DUF1311 family)
MEAIKIFVAVILVLLFEIPAIAATRTDPIVASFDCKKAKTNYEALVCSDYGLAAADVQMFWAYRQALILTPDENKQQTIVAEQWKWHETISSFLQDQSKSMSPERLAKFLDKSIRVRIGALRSIKSELGKTIILDNSLENGAVCSSLLNEKNITWKGKNDSGQDQFALRVPSGFSSPEWENIGIATHAKFDFMNIGEPADVFFVSMVGTHVQFHYYIVAKPEESDTINNMLRADKDMNDAMDIPAMFTYATPSTRRENSPKYESILFNTSSSPVYGWGWYTESEVIQKAGVTYLISKSVNNLEEPTFTVFKPAGAQLNPICYYRAYPSTETKDNRIVPPAGYNVQADQNDE